ncbi:hypothetical protein Q3V94_10185 [Caloramator sp. CAR-1]|uniref:DUF6115 domain-containing protein n=1 Tax=Caloramator sp. CAR-1 TaxID=3062777 RepID=UPI0026E2C144|nr:hypothetical protein [Caloramator sp. CAR-1]MDO6355425.1 hypothetical protein [Caloramator sp. CAR-1]
MNFILIILGLLFIYLSFLIKKLKPKEIMGINPIMDFENIISEKLYYEENKLALKEIKETLMEILDRIENVELSLISLGEEIENLKKDEIKEEKTTIKDAKAVETNEMDGKDINDKIYEMTLAGLTVDEISSKLNLGKGEVLLRLGLMKARK